jgi:hypothetical protein
MASRIGVQLPRLVVFVVVGVLATATMTWGAATQLTSTPTVAARAPVVPRTLVVPDVTRQAYVFAKGTLEDAGFAWQVSGGVLGYAANTVASQSPVAGTRVRDTGAPTVRLTLARNARYPQRGTPENLSPYRGTPLVLAGKRPAKTAVPAARKAVPATPKPVERKAAAPSAAKRAAKQLPRKRPPAFEAAGAPKEPLDEMPLVERARLLQRWLATGPKPTNANVRHFLYQHAWVVTGARFGWWHGSEALRVLIAADVRAERLWSIGASSGAAARRALAEVEARSR